jgi:hypothetical protein
LGWTHAYVLQRCLIHVFYSGDTSEKLLWLGESANARVRLEVELREADVPVTQLLERVRDRARDPAGALIERADIVLRRFLEVVIHARAGSGVALK